MMFKGLSWTGMAGGVVLYSIVFLVVRYYMAVGSTATMQACPSLLMLTIPGALSALTSKEAPLTVTLLSALLATPMCLVIIHFYSQWCHDLIQELAFDTSAIFWCGSGALLVMLLRTIFWRSHNT